MGGFTIPGGSTVQPAQVAYAAIALTATQTLVWPTQALSSTGFAARVMNVTPSSAGFNLNLPPANQVSTGFDIIINNVGSYSFTVGNNSGGTIVVVAPGQSYYLIITDDTTVNGTWYTLLFGAGSSSLSAGSITNSAYDIVTLSSYLHANHSVSSTASSPINVSSDGVTNRGTTYEWTGGGGVVNLPLSTAAGNGFYFYLINWGTGSLTITPSGSDTVDTASTQTLAPGNACMLISGGTGAWFTLGRGLQLPFNFTETVISVTGGTLTESLVQAQNVVQKFTGTLTSNQTVVFPSIVQVYYVQNATSGAFTFTLSAAGGGTTVNVPSGQNMIVFSDGTNVVNASNAQIGTLSTLQIAQGSATAPSLAFLGDTQTGLYQPSAGNVGITISGTETALINSTGITAVAGSFNGSGSGLTGTASSLSIGGNAATVTVTSSSTNAYYDMLFANGNSILQSSKATFNPSTGALNIANGSSNTAAYFSTSGSITTVAITDTGGSGANLGLYGNGSTTPNKYIRAISGKLSVVNSAYTSDIFQVSDIGSVLHVQGSNTAPSLSFIPDTQTGLYQPSAGNVGITISGTETALINSTGITAVAGSFNGSGSGLTGTASSLSIGGNAATVTVTSSSTNANYDMLFANGNSILQSSKATFNPSSGTLNISTGSSNTAAGFTTSGSSTTVAITDTGGNGANLGLYGNGSTTPNKYIRAVSGFLSVVNSAYSSDIFQVSDIGSVLIGAAAMFNDLGSGFPLQINAPLGNSLLAARITNSGTTGASQAAAYQLTTSSANSAASFQLNDNSGSPYAGVNTGSAVTKFSYAAPLHVFSNQPNTGGHVTITAGGTSQSLAFDNTGTVYFGGSGSSTNMSGNATSLSLAANSEDIFSMGAGFTLSHQASTGSAMTVSNYASTGGAVLALTNTNAGTQTMITFATGSGTSGGSISTNGTTTTYGTTSDYRLKENVEAMTGALDRVAALKPVRFNFKSDPSVVLDGFIAHEVQGVVPEAVVGEKDGEQMQALDAAKLVPLLTAALQELEYRVELLERLQ